MKQSFLLVFVFLRCFSCEVFSIENCPNAKNFIESDKVDFDCWGGNLDPCYINIRFDFTATFKFDIPQDVRRVLCDVTFTGNSINATASGHCYIPRNRDEVYVWTKMKGNMPIGHNGTATVKLFFSEQLLGKYWLIKGNPDYCVRTNITIVNN